MSTQSSSTRPLPVPPALVRRLAALVPRRWRPPTTTPRLDPDTPTERRATPDDRLRLLTEIAPSLRDVLHAPGTPAYQALTTPWNLTVAVQPMAVLAAQHAGQVVLAVRTAGQLGLRVAVQRTGHGGTPVDAGTLLVHTGAIEHCTVDPGTRTARVGAGVLWQRVVDEAAGAGLAALSGAAPGVSVAGFLTGGGIGPMVRSVGASSDHVVAFDVVTGDGVLRRATPETEPDLFWGLRGGKSTLGIVTAVEVDLLPVEEVLAGQVWFAGDDASAVVHGWARWCDDLPWEVSTSLVLVRLPPLPDLPPVLAGRSTVCVRFVWTGDPAQGEQLLSELRALATPVLDTVARIPYSAIGSVHGDPVEPVPARERGGLLSGLPTEAVDRLLRLAGPGADSPLAGVELRLLGGAFATDPAVPSALCHRDAAFTVLTVGMAVPGQTDPAEAGERLLAGLARWVTGSALPNFEPRTDPAALARCYDTATRQRLADLAGEYDPTGVLDTGRAVRDLTRAGRG